MTLQDLIAKANVTGTGLTPGLLSQGLANPDQILQFARQSPDASRQFIAANPDIVQAFSTQFPDFTHQLSGALFPGPTPNPSETPAPHPPVPGGSSLVPGATGPISLTSVPLAPGPVGVLPGNVPTPVSTPAPGNPVKPTPTRTPPPQPVSLPDTPLGSLTTPLPFPTPPVSSPTISLPPGTATPPTFQPLPPISVPPAVIPPAPVAPTLGGAPNQTVQDLVSRFVTGTQDQGTTQINRQLHEILFPELKSAAAASGQISPEGAVSGPFLENLARLGERGQRAVADVVKGAQTEGLGKLIDQTRFQDQSALEQYRLQLGDAVQRGQLSLGQADLALKVAQTNLASKSQQNDFALRSFQTTQQGDIARLQASLQAQVAAGQLSVSQAELALNTAKASADATLRQQGLQTQLLDLLSGRQLQTSQLALGAIDQANQRRLQELLGLSGLGSSDLERLLQGVQALKQGGVTQTTSEGGSVLRDLLGIGASAATISSSPLGPVIGSFLSGL